MWKRRNHTKKEKEKEVTNHSRYSKINLEIMKKDFLVSWAFIFYYES